MLLTASETQEQETAEPDKRSTVGPVKIIHTILVCHPPTVRFTINAGDIKKV